MNTLQTPMNRFKFVRSIKSNDDAFWCEKLFNTISFTSEQLEDLKTLHRFATTLHRLDENSCNGWPRQKTEFREGKMYCYDVEDESWRLRDEKKEANIRKKIDQIEKRNDQWEVELQGDPRGWPMKLTVQGIDCSILVNYK